MYLLGKYVQDLTEDDIKRLIENEIRESKTLEYKKQLLIPQLSVVFLFSLEINKKIQ